MRTILSATLAGLVLAGCGSSPDPKPDDSLTSAPDAPLENPVGIEESPIVSEESIVDEPEVDSPIIEGSRVEETLAEESGIDQSLLESPGFQRAPTTNQSFSFPFPSPPRSMSDDREEEKASAFMPPAYPFTSHPPFPFPSPVMPSPEAETEAEMEAGIEVETEAEVRIATSISERSRSPHPPIITFKPPKPESVDTVDPMAPVDLAGVSKAVDRADPVVEVDPVDPTLVPSEYPIDPDLEREIRLKADEYLERAQEAERNLAKRWQLEAITILFENGQPDRAAELLDRFRIDEPEESPPGYSLLAARIALWRAEPERVLDILAVPPELPDDGSNEHARRSYRLLRARAFEDIGQWLAAARERDVLDFLIDDPTRREANRSALWDLLFELPPADRKKARAGASPSLDGWIRLADAWASHRHAPNALRRELTAWLRDFPTHPAKNEIVGMMLGSILTPINRPTHIALLLPLLGDFAEAGGAVRDGFLAAWYADDPNRERASVEIHDSSSQDIAAVYHRAVENGADFVVGPLERMKVASLLCESPLPVTTLALNESEARRAPEDEDGADPSPECPRDAEDLRLYHFDLAPGAEARQVAERAYREGFEKAAVLVRDGEWGKRVARGFIDAWEAVGGIVVDRRALPADATLVGETVAESLQIRKSEKRALDMRKILATEELGHEPRRRKDIDFIFMADFPVGARQTKPQISFHHARDLPVYSTSHVYGGAHDPSKDIDLEGIVFADMPWLIAPMQKDRELRQTLDLSIENRKVQLNRLYAFGADAYRLAVRLRRIAGSEGASFRGHTGELSLGSDRRIRRSLSWARFQDGVPIQWPEIDPDSLSGETMDLPASADETPPPEPIPALAPAES
ncbi:penicillin-binding protein activator [Thioalkalivibrio sp. HK1]|uniref:penicillin-binding protein activator n=1 Tax=Thioalkalivibrio sp. HK1 TaxID=1469245 RepID=UPI0018CC0387|nr:penicillin-binding protein activator [Thioalkalivibrio sp. HK1]